MSKQTLNTLIFADDFLFYYTCQKMEWSIIKNNFSQLTRHINSVLFNDGINYQSIKYTLIWNY